MKDLIVILSGGLSGEREISFLTGKACFDALKKRGYRVKNLDAKGYFVKVRGLMKNETLSILRKGPILRKIKHLPVKAKILHTINNKTWLEIFLQEGKNRQIKKMLLSLGYPVQKIKRFKVGPISLGNLKSGEYRALDDEELKLLLDNK